MKKILLSCTAAFMLMQSLQAQTYNRTYSIPGYSCAKPGIIPANAVQNRQYTYTVTNLSDGTNSKQVLLSRLDNDGNVNLAVKVDRITTATWAGSRFIPTKDGGVLLTCLDENGLVTVLKFDADLNQMWAVSIPDNLGHMGTSSLGAISTGSLDGDAKREDYIIVMPVETSNGYTSDEAFMAFRLDDRGQVLWKKKYSEFNRAANYNNPIIQDQVTTIVHSEPNQAGEPNERFIIAGMRSETGYSPVCGWVAVVLPTSPNDIFALRIDAWGNIISNYNRYTAIASSGKSRLQMITDRLTGNYVCTFSQYNMGPANNYPVGIALMQLDYSLNAMGSMANVYFQNGSIENYVSALNQPSDGNYVINSYPMGNSYALPELIKIDRNTMNVLYNQNYNFTSHAQLDYDAGQIDDNDYNLFVSTPGNFTNADLRVIKADPSGYACGAEQQSTIAATIPVTQEQFNYEAIDFPQFNEVRYEQEEIAVQVSDCGSAYFRTQAAANVLNEVKVYPTVLSSAGDKLTCKLSGTYNGVVNIRITNVLGQQVFSKNCNVENGAEITIDANTLSTGLNVVNIYNNGKVIKTEKVILAN